MRDPCGPVHLSRACKRHECRRRCGTQDAETSLSLTVSPEGCRHSPPVTAPEGPRETPCKQTLKQERGQGGAGDTRPGGGGGHEEAAGLTVPRLALMFPLYCDEEEPSAGAPELRRESAPHSLHARCREPLWARDLGRARPVAPGPSQGHTQGLPPQTSQDGPPASASVGFGLLADSGLLWQSTW